MTSNGFDISAKCDFGQIAAIGECIRINMAALLVDEAGSDVLILATEKPKIGVFAVSEVIRVVIKGIKILKRSYLRKGMPPNANDRFGDVDAPQ